MNILLLSTNIHREPEPVFPLGVAYLAAGLKAGGHGAACLDLLRLGPESRELKKK
jgi:hypothetical protein